MSSSSMSPTSITDITLNSPKTSSNSKPWNDYKQQQQQEKHQISSLQALTDSHKTNLPKISKSELLEIQSEIDSVKRLPKIFYL